VIDYISQKIACKIWATTKTGGGNYRFGKLSKRKQSCFAQLFLKAKK